MEKSPSSIADWRQRQKEKKEKNKERLLQEESRERGRKGSRKNAKAAWQTTAAKRRWEM